MESGKYSSYTNGIVRSFDTVKYNLRFTLEDTGKDEEDEGNQEETPSVTYMTPYSCGWK